MADCSNTLPCLCPNESCARHGKCCECVAHHRDNKGNYPNCFKVKFEQNEETK